MIIIDRRKIRYAAGFIAVLIVIVAVIEFSGKLIYPQKYSEYVFQYSDQYNIDPYLVFAIIKAESNFEPKAVSHKDARGLMQITERTGKWAAECMQIIEFDTKDLFDPEINISIGCWYLSILMKEFNGNTDLVIAAYNGGSGRVREWLKNKEYSNSGKSLDKIPYKETMIYLKRVKSYYTTYKELYE